MLVLGQRLQVQAALQGKGSSVCRVSSKVTYTWPSLQVPQVSTEGMGTFVQRKDLNKEICGISFNTQVYVKRRNFHLSLKIKFIFTQHGTPDHKLVRSPLVRFPNPLLAAEEPDQIGHLILILILMAQWLVVNELLHLKCSLQTIALSSEWQQYALTHTGTAFCGYCQNILGYTVSAFSGKWRRRQEIQNASLAPRDSRPQRRFPSITAEVWANRG